MNEYGYSGNNICESARLKAIMLQEQISKKMLIDKNLLGILQEELSIAKKMIEKLNNDKAKLKNALADSISKRDNHYHQYLHYKNLYEEIKNSSDRVTNNKKIEKKGDIGKKLEKQLDKQQILTRDQKIKELYDEIQRLEEQLMKKDVDSTSWKDLYNASKYINNESILMKSQNHSKDIKDISTRVLIKIKQDKPLYSAFKEVANCSKYFLSLLGHQLWDEALFKLLMFCEILLNNFKIESLSLRTPSFSPHIHLTKHSSGSSSDYSPQVSILNPESSITKDCSYQNKEKQAETPKNFFKSNLKIPRIARINKSSSDNALKSYL